MRDKDQTLLEEAYGKIINEGNFAKVQKITDGGFGHGGHVAVAPDSLDGHDEVPSKQTRRASRQKDAPKYCKIVTGKDYPQIDRWLHMWYNESPAAGEGGSYAEMQGPISDSDISYWLKGDNEAIKFFIKNKAALINAAENMAS